MTLYKGVGTDVHPMENCNTDGLITLVQKFYHKMNFRNENIKVWIRHLTHLKFNNRAAQLAKTKYHRVWSKTMNSNKFCAGNESDLYKNRYQKNTCKPKCLQEHLWITECLSINQFSMGKTGGRYNQYSIYNSLALITTELVLESEAEKSTSWNYKVVSIEDKGLAEMVDHVFGFN